MVHGTETTGQSLTELSLLLVANHGAKVSFTEDQPDFPANDFTDQLTDDEVTVPENEDDSAGTSAGARGASKASSNRALIRRVASKAGEVASADPSVRSIAASLLGVGEDLADMTTAIMTSGREVLNPFRDLKKIAEADPFDSPVIAGALETAARRRVWLLLDSLGLTSGADLPVSTSKAGVLVARTVHGLNLDDIQDELDEVEKLLKKA